MSDNRKLFKDLIGQGFTLRRTSRGHTVVKRDGAFVAVFGGTPSDWRSGRNMLAQLRRAGFVPST